MQEQDIVNTTRPLTKRSEGQRLTAYQDTGGVWTIGFGHTGHGVIAGLKITAERAEELLEADLHVAARTVLRLVRVPLTTNQAAALTDFVFNLGSLAFAGSTLLKVLNQGHYDQVPSQLLRWTKGTVKGIKQDLPGLTARRKAEVTLWNTP